MICRKIKITKMALPIMYFTDTKTCLFSEVQKQVNGVITLVVFGTGTGTGTGTRTMGDNRCRSLSLKFITCEHNNIGENIGDGLNFVMCEQSFKHNA